MMYLSRVKLNVDKRKTQIALSSPALFHGAVEHAFQNKQERNLWRIDTLNDNYYILIVSEAVPDLSGFVSQFGYDTEPAQTKEYSHFIERMENGSLWRFRLVANPTRCLKQTDERGKVTAHVTETYQLEWIKKKAEQNGFEILENTCKVTGKEWKNFLKKNETGKRKVTLLQVAFEGVLRVNDPEKFKKCLTDGIGRGKAYGSGLLTVTRI